MATQYFYIDDDKKQVRAKLNSKSIHFPNVKTCIESVDDDLFKLSLLPKKGVNGFYPVAIDKTMQPKEIVFPIKYHTLQIVPPNPCLLYTSPSPRD